MEEEGGTLGGQWEAGGILAGDRRDEGDKGLDGCLCEPGRRLVRC